MRSGGHGTSDHKTIHHKQLNGIPAGLSAKVLFLLLLNIQDNQAIK